MSAAKVHLKQWCNLLPSGKLTWQWKTTIFNRRYIFTWWIFHCYVSLPEGNFLENLGSKYHSFLLVNRIAFFFKGFPVDGNEQQLLFQVVEIVFFSSSEVLLLMVASLQLTSTNTWPLKIGRAPKGNFIFQPPIFVRCQGDPHGAQGSHL